MTTLMLTDGGLETVLIFEEGLELPAFAAFDLVGDDEGRATLRRYFDAYAEVAERRGTGLVLGSPTWRASANWGPETGYTAAEIDDFNRRSIEFMQELRESYSPRVAPIAISGCVGPEGDGYNPDRQITAEEAEEYHARQIGIFADARADLVTAMTLTYVDEAVGIVRAAESAGLPVWISLTVETDGRLPGDQALGEAIDRIDEQTGGATEAFMINCAHPTHFADALEPGTRWIGRIGGLRVNASTKSHAELDESTELDAGDPDDLAARHAALAEMLPSVRVLGGCCGTDHRHVDAIAGAWLGATS